MESRLPHPRTVAANRRFQLLRRRLRLRFSRRLEREFVTGRAQQMAPLVRLTIVLALLLVAAFLLHDALTAHRLQWLYVYALVFGVGGITTLLPFLLGLYKPFSSAYRRTGFAAVTVNAFVLVAVQVISQVRGVPWPYEILLIKFLYDFYFSGLVLRWAAPIALITWIGYGATSAITGLDSSLLWHRLFFMGTVILLGSLTCLVGERTERLAWLRRRRLDRLALRDHLTGLANRRSLNERAPQLLRQATRERKAIGLLMIDLDYFKRLNDLRGHLVGDGALRAVATTIGQRARRGLDLAVRWGGEEFLLLLYDCAPQALVGISENLREELAALCIGNPGVPTGQLTASIGSVCCVPGQGLTLHQLISAADKAMYRAKLGGRNRVVVEPVECSWSVQQATSTMANIT